MLLTREEMSFDFGGAKLDPQRDRDVLAWMFNQFLYGEVTGIQIGHWIYNAPDLETARFLSRQALEEFQHVDNFLKIMGMLGVRPGDPHPVVRFLATGMMGDSWPEHVSMEMASGEGFVLMAFYALIDTLDHPPTVAILKRAVRQEERHVEFGEQQTQKLIRRDPALRRRLLGLSLVWMWGVQRLADYMERHLPKEHPVLSQLRPFLAHTMACHELRLRRIGLLDRPLRELSTARKTALVSEAYAWKATTTARELVMAPLRWLPTSKRKQLLTDTYLTDPIVRSVWQESLHQTDAEAA